MEFSRSTKLPKFKSKTKVINSFVQSTQSSNHIETIKDYLDAQKIVKGLKAIKARVQLLFFSLKIEFYFLEIFESFIFQNFFLRIFEKFYFLKF